MYHSCCIDELPKDIENISWNCALCSYMGYLDNSDNENM